MLNLSPEEYNKFYPSLEFVLKWEGGYVNDPDDPGGETKWGISKRYHPDLDIKNLTPEQAASIYHEKYWLPVGCDMLDLPLCTVAFDTAVNLGPARAVEFLEKADFVPARLLEIRRLYYHQKVAENPVKRKYINGWLNRLNDLRKFCDGYKVG